MKYNVTCRTCEQSITVIAASYYDLAKHPKQCSKCKKERVVKKLKEIKDKKEESK